MHNNIEVILKLLRKTGRERFIRLQEEYKEITGSHLEETSNLGQSPHMNNGITVFAYQLERLVSLIQEMVEENPNFYLTHPNEHLRELAVRIKRASSEEAVPT